MFTSLFLVLLGGVMTLAGTIQFQQFVSHVSTDIPDFWYSEIYFKTQSLTGP